MRAVTVAVLCSVLTGAALAALFFWWYSGTLPKEVLSKIEIQRELEAKGWRDFRFESVGKKAFSGELSSLKEKVVILNFWASWCGPCIEEFPVMIKLVEEFPGDVALVAVSSDSRVEDMNAFLLQLKGWEQNGIYIVHDSTKQFLVQYGVDRLPESFIFGPDRKLIRRVVGAIDWYTPESIQFIRELINSKQTVE